MAIRTVGCESYLLFALTQVETIHRDGDLNESAAAGDATGAPTAIEEVISDGCSEGAEVVRKKRQTALVAVASDPCNFRYVLIPSRLNTGVCLLHALPGQQDRGVLCKKQSDGFVASGKFNYRFRKVRIQVQVRTQGKTERVV